MKIVIYPAIDETRHERIIEAAREATVVNCTSPEEAQSEIINADGFFGKITPDLLKEAIQLRWVQAPTASLENYIFPELVNHDCELTNMKGLFSDVVADHTIGLILCIARNLHIYLRQQQQALWQPLGFEPTQPTLASSVGMVTEIDRRHRHLPDCTLGIVGVGSIGAEIARRAAAFGMKVQGIDPITQSVAGAIDVVKPVSALPELLATSDFVCIAAPHTPETVKLFRLEQFEQMKRDAWLINVGRGAVVDLADLNTALDQQFLGGAALDVIETEPLPADNPLWPRENVLITPHVAAASPRVAERHLETLLENVRRFTANMPLRNVVSKHLWY